MKNVAIVILCLMVFGSTAYAAGNESPKTGFFLAAAGDLLKPPANGTPELQLNTEEMQRLRAELLKLTLENALEDERHKKELNGLRHNNNKLVVENDRLSEMMRAQELKNSSELAKFKFDMERRTKKEEWEQQTNRNPVVLKNPYQNGVLTISDCRISLNGVIGTGVSDYVSDRIDYFNNISDDPIFIVIDRCPGGSVMEGYRIVTSIQSSKAPVHVVVKSFAASMCAVITTSAPHSYAYPNAIILHHQISMMLGGNMTQTKERLENAKEWWRRFAGPVAKKMGVSIEKFVKMMYEKNSDGDWEEFGDGAVALKWVDTVVHEIRETGVIKKPNDTERSSSSFAGRAPNEKLDEKGDPYVHLPRLGPFDFYWVYNPDRYYR